MSTPHETPAPSDLDSDAEAVATNSPPSGDAVSSQVNDVTHTSSESSLDSAASTQAMDPQIKSIQPGGGVVMSIELAWGRVRRAWLRTFRPAYVQKMRELRKGSRGELPFEPVDARDVKFFRNQPTFWWEPSDDPHHYRESFPFVRVGLAELLLLGGGSLLAALVLGWVWWPLAIPMLVVAVLVIWFFRDPVRAVPQAPGTVVSPADGKLVQIERVNDAVLGPCLQFGIFLSIFNVHANRASLAGRVVDVRYRPGKFLNALRPESAQENENLDVTFESDEVGGRRFRVRQITGQFARRIVCWAKPGDQFSRGEMFGMIKLGSRTELLIPDESGIEVVAQMGQKLAAGNTVLAVYKASVSEHPTNHSTPPGE